MNFGSVANRVLERISMPGNTVEIGIFENTKSYKRLFATEPGSLVCGAREEDARRIGLDEGLKPTHWVEGLQRRGIGVIQDIGREEASSILFQYHERGGITYNGREQAVEKTCVGDARRESGAKSGFLPLRPSPTQFFSTACSHPL